MNDGLRNMSTTARLARFTAAVAVFGVLGPPVGGVVAWLVMGAAAGRSPVEFVTGAYGEGALLALGAGAIVAGAALWFGARSWLVPVGAALAVDALLMLGAVVGDPQRPDLAGLLGRLAGVFVPPSLAASLVCWAATRRLLRPA